MIRRPPRSTLFPYRRSSDLAVKRFAITAGTTRKLNTISTPAIGTASVITTPNDRRSEEHTSELQSQSNLVCRLLLEKKKKKNHDTRDNQQAKKNKKR